MQGDATRLEGLLRWVPLLLTTGVLAHILFSIMIHPWDFVGFRERLEEAFPTLEELIVLKRAVEEFVSSGFVETVRESYNRTTPLVALFQEE